MNAFSQDLSDYRWKNRLFVIVTDHIDSQTYLAQMKEFERNETGLTERKLLIFTATPLGYTLGTKQDSDWQASKNLYKQFKRKDNTFEVILIGLDGGIKRRKTGLLKLEELFAIIDGMPMRRKEIRNK